MTHFLHFKVSTKDRFKLTEMLLKRKKGHITIARVCRCNVSELPYTVFHSCELKTKCESMINFSGRFLSEAKLCTTTKNNSSHIVIRSYTFPVGNKCRSILSRWLGLHYLLLPLLIGWTGRGVIWPCQVPLCRCSLRPAVETVGPIDHLSLTSRFEARSPEQGTRGGGTEMRLDGGISFVLP